jgi:membrane protease YdiL (CAAX protease family)
MKTELKPTILRFIVEFCLVELVVSIPFWLFTYFAYAGIIPGGLNNGFPLINWSLTPAISSCLLVYRRNKLQGLKQLLARCVDFKRIHHRAVWLIPIFLLWPAIIFVMYLVAILSNQHPSTPQFTWQLPLLYFLLVPGVLGEEYGWTGYLIDPLQDRLGALRGALIVGAIWALFHSGVYVAYGWSLEWCFWQCIYVVASRVLFVWLYNNAGKSLFVIALLHPAFGCYYVLWPVNSIGLPDFYNPATMALTTILIAIIVVMVYGPKTLVRQSQYSPVAKSRVTVSEE